MKWLEQEGGSDVYGVFLGDDLAHVAWLIPVEHDRRLAVRKAKLRAGEAEIARCYTLPQYRGSGVYLFAIRSLCAIALSREIRRVFMLAGLTNAASQRGIEKAGFSKVGAILHCQFTWWPALLHFSVRRYGR